VLRTIEIDWDNTSELSKAITKLQKRRKHLLELNGSKPLTFAASKYNAEHIIPFLDVMYNMSSNYISLSENNTPNYYVYAHCDPRKPLNARTNLKHLFLASKFGLKFEPFYIGKGIGNRANDLNRNDSHRKIRSLIRKDNKEVVVSILDKDLSASDALHKESALMDILGLKSILQSGFLVNLDEGLSYDRHVAYSKLQEWKQIEKILKINKIKTGIESKNYQGVVKIEKINVDELNDNLEKLKTLYNKYPSASYNFIVDKAQH
jgi:hypothetical protein